MFKKGLEEEFNNWLGNTEFDEETLNKIDNLSDMDINHIIDNVLDDNMLTQEMFNCFEYYLNMYLKTQKESK